MSWGTILKGTKDEIAAKLDAEKERLMPLLASIPTEQADMVSAMDRAKHYASLIDLDAYNKAYGFGSTYNGIKVEASGSHSTVRDNVVCASCRFDVSPVQI